MVSRKKLVQQMASNLTSSIIHLVLFESTDNIDLKAKYRKEVENNLDEALKYRLRINPPDRRLNEFEDIRLHLLKKVEQKIEDRISRGYTISRSLILPCVETILENI